MWNVNKFFKPCLRDRILALKNGWNKEANDILNELHQPFSICIPTRTSINRFTSHILSIYDSLEVPSGSTKENQTELRKIRKQFAFKSECEKNEAFKRALLWILEESEKPKVGQDHDVEIKGVKVKVRILEMKLEK